MLLLGEPVKVSAQATVAGTGVDEQVAVSMAFADGAVASAYASYVAASPVEAHVIGSEARVHVPSPMHHPQHLDVIRGGELTRVSLPHEGSGYEFEVAEVHRALQAGETESPRRPPADTIAVMRVLDDVRSRIGLAYPGE
jgi:predicted dehydrogenase